MNGACVAMIDQPASGVVVVADAGPLIHLDELDCLDLLNDFKQIMVPDAVWREVQRESWGTLLSIYPRVLGDAVIYSRRVRRDAVIYFSNSHNR